eukprot:6964234-Heterocapsa_arctica.AAC.1
MLSQPLSSVRQTSSNDKRTILWTLISTPSEAFFAQALTQAHRTHLLAIAMARSNGRAAVIAALCALGYASW